MTRMARLIDITRCTACRGCQVSCKRWNQLEGEIGPFTGSFQSHDDMSPGRWTMINFYEEKKSHGLEWHFRKNCCMHCAEAGCLKACPNNALVREENGTIRRIEENCIGCGHCVQFCPFNIPRIDEAAKKMKKCTFCYDRITNDREPACAKTCVPQAIVYGTWDDMVRLAEQRLDQAKPRYPRARIYGRDELGGLGVIYVLPDSAANYGLPEDPRLPFTLGLWKDVVHPFGNAVLGASLAATGLAFIISRRNAMKLKESAKLAEGGYNDEQQKND
ncbi:4Fe-4S dicluster domain-containing protein [Desulfurivibrio sp. C05AmB]|jgi:formate dehydrogenase iron-sulfur subunit|uniref:4Fe-4S dicluster domain-containing protein n=1 Tax=Desulfurivibrio sp. C05AmB TaxID=3374371 RepID=UPI00376F02E4